MNKFKFVLKPNRRCHLQDRSQWLSDHRTTAIVVNCVRSTFIVLCCIQALNPRKGLVPGIVLGKSFSVAGFSKTSLNLANHARNNIQRIHGTSVCQLDSDFQTIAFHDSTPFLPNPSWFRIDVVLESTWENRHIIPTPKHVRTTKRNRSFTLDPTSGRQIARSRDQTWRHGVKWPPVFVCNDPGKASEP